MIMAILLASLLSFVGFPALAHPVSFKGSKGIMGYHSPNLTHNQVNYSFDYWWALGAHHFRRPNQSENRHASLATANILFKRWNGEKLQANVYGLAGFGKSELVGNPKDVGFGGVQFDIEDRDYYFLIKHSQILESDLRELEQSTVRLGLTPYVGAYEDLHTWFILEGQKTTFGETENVENLTPFVRLFYRNVLLEFGQSFNGESRFNYIIHF